MLSKGHDGERATRWRITTRMDGSKDFCGDEVMIMMRRRRKEGRKKEEEDKDDNRDR